MKTDFELLTEENEKLKEMIMRMAGDRINPPVIIKHDSEQYEKDATAKILQLQVRIAELEEILDTQTIDEYVY